MGWLRYNSIKFLMTVTSYLACYVFFFGWISSRNSVDYYPPLKECSKGNSQPMMHGWWQINFVSDRSIDTLSMHERFVASNTESNQNIINPLYSQHKAQIATTNRHPSNAKVYIATKSNL